MRPEWMDLGACRTGDGELTRTMYPTPGDEVGIAEAKAICMRCDVQVECLSYALSIREPQGVWGGVDERERRNMWRRWKRREFAAGFVVESVDAMAAPETAVQLSLPA